MEREEACDCGTIAVRLFRPSPNNIFKSKGLVENPEYNPGLGCVVKNKKDLKEICKAKGLEPIGNEKPETVHKYYDTKRQEKIDKAYDDADKGWVGSGE